MKKTKVKLNTVYIELNSGAFVNDFVFFKKYKRFKIKDNPYQYNFCFRTKSPDLQLKGKKLYFDFLVVC